MAKPYSAIPGPRETFLLGSFFRRFGDPMKFFRDLNRKFGPIVRFSLLHEKLLMVTDPDMVEEILVTQQASFHKGRALEQAKSFLGNSVLVSEEGEHRRQRKLLQPAFHRERIARYAAAMSDHSVNWANNLKAGEDIDLAGQMNRLTLQIVATTLFGSTVESEANEIADSLTVVIENFNRLIMPMARFIQMMPTRRNRRLREAQKRLDATVYRLIAERRKSKEDKGDLLSMLLAATDAESEQKRLTDQEVRDQAMTLFVAGHETTANGLSWCWHQLAEPEAKPIRERLRDEVLSVVGPDRAPTLDDMGRLVYTRAVFAESMRLYPPAWAIGRRSIRQVELGGYVIPPRVIVVTTPFLIHRDPRLWPDADKFRPERWLPPESQERHKFAYFPFGAGARGCMGESFAWTEAILVLACIARKWAFTYRGPKPTMNPVMTLRPNGGMPMRVEAA